MEKGILIVATKHPYYGRMAYNLAVSIKAAEDFPVAVLHSGRGIAHLSGSQREIFSHIIEIESEGIGSKLEIYEHSPFEKTLYIDADNLWFPKRTPSELFETLSGCEFTGITEGKYDIDKDDNQLRKDYFLWADADQMVKAYNLKGVFYQWRSEFIYFTKTEQNRKLFDYAKEIFNNPLVDVKQFAEGVPDEFAINVAACHLGISPHEYQYQPCYWDKAKAIRFRPVDLYSQYWILSTGGNRFSQQTKAMYARVMMAACHKLGLQYLFTLQSKASTITERQKI